MRGICGEIMNWWPVCFWQNKRRRKNRRRSTPAPTTASKDLGGKPLTVPAQNLETASTPGAVPSSTTESLPKRRRNRRKKNRTTSAPDSSTIDSSLEDDEAPPNRERLVRNRLWMQRFDLSRITWNFRCVKCHIPMSTNARKIDVKATLANA